MHHTREDMAYYAWSSDLKDVFDADICIYGCSLVRRRFAPGPGHRTVLMIFRRQAVRPNDQQDRSKEQ